MSDSTVYNYGPIRKQGSRAGMTLTLTVSWDTFLLWEAYKVGLAENGDPTEQGERVKQRLEVVLAEACDMYPGEMVVRLT